MAVELNFVDDDLYEAVRQFLLAILPAGVDAVQGQDNRVPEPLENDFIVMTGMHWARLGTNVDTFDGEPGASTMQSGAATEYGVQLDVHGPNSADNSTRVFLAWRSSWAAQFLRGSIISPLYADEPRQAAFGNAEEQYETRWIVTIYLEAQPVLTLPQDYATELAIQVEQADQ